MPDNTASIPLRQRPAQFAGNPLADCPPKSVRSLYLHIPFCNHKCHYCDFYSLVDPQDRQASFTARLIEELHALAPLAGALDTIFVGGGTPTLLAPDLWKRLGDALDDLFDIPRDRVEFTVECNPETASTELFAVLAAAGVNRLSVGMQSFNPKHLATLERLHNPDNVARTFDLARQAGINRLSGDLIYAIPGQTLDDLDEDLSRALELGSEHLSCYNLTYEPRTAMTARLERGLIDPCPEELEIEMFEHAALRLGDAGFERYEVSNYAKPGQACRHNLAYWRQDDWLAGGPSAAGHAAGHRWKNQPHLDTYLNYHDLGFAPIIDHEEPDLARALREKIMTGLRLADGLDRSLLILQAQNALAGSAAELETEIGLCVNEGMLIDADTRLKLTNRGILFADGIAARLMGCLH
jgi:oxygen-independent coproporphyrinogen III oxidase